MLLIAIGKRTFRRFTLSKGNWHSNRNVPRNVPTSPVNKLPGNFPVTLGFFSNFQLLERLSVHRATFSFLCLDSDSNAPATNEKLKSAKYSLCREYICPIFFSFTIR